MDGWMDGQMNTAKLSNKDWDNHSDKQTYTIHQCIHAEGNRERDRELYLIKIIAIQQSLSSLVIFSSDSNQQETENKSIESTQTATFKQTSLY